MSTTPISLYIDLFDDQVADLEVVARASLAFSKAIKEVAFIVDPSIEVRVELASGTEGSLSLNSLIRLVRGNANPAALKKVALAILFYFALESRDFVFDKAMEALTGKVVGEQEEPVTKADLEAFLKQLQEHPVQPQAQQVFRELERDPAIKGVGATINPGARPEQIVPRSEFSDRAGTRQIIEHGIHRRVVKDRASVILISPVLIPGERRWRLRTSTGEHGFTIKDKDFMDAVLSGRTSIPMVAGIELEVEIETQEEFRDGVWVILERDVTHVSGLTRPPTQQSLPLSGEH